MEVIEITLKGEALNDSVLKVIDRGIPYQLLFLLKRGEEYQLCMGYKETETSAVKEYFKTDWMTFEALPLQITGLTLDDVYDNFIRQIHGNLQSAERTATELNYSVSGQEARLNMILESINRKIIVPMVEKTAEIISYFNNIKKYKHYP